MIIYLDSSALVKLYVTEAHHDYVEDVVRQVGRVSVGIVAVSAIVYPEALAALAAMSRAGRITPRHYERAMEKLLNDLSGLYLVRPVTGRIIERAAALPASVLGTPSRYMLKGYDAVQLATALDLGDELMDRAMSYSEGFRAQGEYPPEPRPEELLVLSFDERLHDATVAEGIAHVRPNRAGGRTFEAP